MKSTVERIAVLAAALTLGCATGPKAITAKAPTPELAQQFHRIESKGAVALAAGELSCEPDQVRVWDRGNYVRASGCGRVAYFVKVTPKQWERAGPLFEIAEPDRELALPSLEGLTMPEVLFRAEPVITPERWKRIHHWQPFASVDCIVRLDGTLGYCFILTSEPAISEAVSEALNRYKFRPATYQGHPVPISYTFGLKFKVERPNCYGLSSPMARAQCERALKDLPEDPAD